MAQRLAQGTHNPLVPGSNPGGPNDLRRFGMAGTLKRHYRGLYSLDIETFVAETLRQVRSGVFSAETDGVSIDKGQAPPNPMNVDFDIAVTVNEESSKEGGGKIQVWGVNLGGTAASQTSSTSVSRVQFTIPIVLGRSKRSAQ